MDYGFGTKEGVQWSAADQYYLIQYSLIRRISEAFLIQDFDSAFKFVHELYDLTFAYYDKKVCEQIEKSFDELRDSFQLVKGQMTKELAAKKRAANKKNLESLRKIKRTIMQELKKQDMLVQYKGRDFRSIAERNNK